MEFPSWPSLQFLIGTFGPMQLTLAPTGKPASKYIERQFNCLLLGLFVFLRIFVPNTLENFELSGEGRATSGDPITLWTTWNATHQTWTFNPGMTILILFMDPINLPFFYSLNSVPIVIDLTLYLVPRHNLPFLFNLLLLSYQPIQSVRMCPLTGGIVLHYFKSASNFVTLSIPDTIVLLKVFSDCYCLFHTSLPTSQSQLILQPIFKVSFLLNTA